MESGNSLTGGMVISRTLQKFGVHTAFALAGASHTFLLDALDKDDFKIILGRHETGTVGAADGYARITRRPGVALIVSDQGIPNAITGILTAYEACSPVIIISVRRLTSSLEGQTLLDHDKLELVRPISKWARTVQSVDRLHDYLVMAYRHALSGRPGPVILQVPQELLRLTVSRIPKLEKSVISASKPGPNAEIVEKAAQLLDEAQQPLIIAGSGAYLSDAGNVLRKLSSAYALPVFGNAMGRGLVPEDDQLGWSWALAQGAAKEADLVIWLGARMTQRLGYGLAPRFKANVKFIQVDINPEEIGRNRYVDVPVNADVALTVQAIHAAMNKRQASIKSQPTWIRAALKERLEFIDTIGVENKGPIHPYKIARELTKQFPPNAVYIGDGADIQNWMHAILRIRTDGGFIDHYPLGSMGIGTPLALGAAAGALELAQANGQRPRTIIHVTGDGAFGFYPSEYNGAVLAALNITTLISNDGAWGTEKHGQRLAINRDVNTVFGDVNYALIAKAFGCYAEQISDPSLLGAAIGRALSHDGPAVLDIITDPEAGALRKTDVRVQTVQFCDLENSLNTQQVGD